MSELTICLVTRGREDFLDATLASLEVIKFKKLAKVLIISNGAPEFITAKLKSWTAQNGADLVTFLDNDTRPNRVWEILRTRRIQWVLFPGDDDVVLPEAIEHFHDIIEKNNLLNAVSFNLQEINYEGKVINIVRKPKFNSSDSKVVQMACVLHEPAFLWPSLFLNVNAIPRLMPTSRFVFDWWVGIQLILKGGIKVVDEVAVNYRQHFQQESNLANLRRKFFEASFWLNELIFSEEFDCWLDSCTSKEVVEFSNLISSRTPIYGNEHFGYPIQLQVARKLMARSDFEEVSNLIGLNLASSQSVFLKKGDIKNFLNGDSLPIHFDKSNIDIVIADGSCEILRNIEKYFHSSARQRRIIVSCLHSDNEYSDLSVSCQNLIHLDGDQIIDTILFRYSEMLEFKGNLQFLITQNERNLISSLRKIRDILPNSIKRIAKVIIFNRLR